MIRSLLLVLSLSLFLSSGLRSETDDPDLRDSLVQIRITNQVPNFMYPWQTKKPYHFNAVGVVVDENKILTLASILEFYTSIEIKKNSSNQFFTAIPLKVDFEANLAVLRIVEEQEFFRDLSPIDFHIKPEINESVSIVQMDGFGNLQDGKGRIVNLENEPYPAGHIEMPYYNINSNEKMIGNGELLTHKNKPVGLLYSFQSSSNNGKAVPGFIIDQFLENSVRKGSTFPYKGFKFKSILDTATREYYGIPEKYEGVIVSGILPRTGASKVLKVNDIIVEFGKKKIDSQGYFQHSEYGKQPITFLAHSGKESGFTKGMKIPVKVIRNRKEMNLELPLHPFPSKSIKIPHKHNFNRFPNYTIRAGFLFTEFSEFLLREWGSTWRSRVDKKLLYMVDYKKFHKKGEKGKILILVQVLPDEANNGYHNLSMELVRLVNNENVTSIKELENKINNSSEEIVRIDLENGTTLAIDKATLKETDERISKKFNIPKLTKY
ncbi:MAG: serine protease [Leptospiraceae bacterium]|nr:serine protease [Leptospiraceae bacterium]MCP5510893.1 serine protease [Leptospiraceae bacterium]